MARISLHALHVDTGIDHRRRRGEAGRERGRGLARMVVHVGTRGRLRRRHADRRLDGRRRQRGRVVVGQGQDLDLAVGLAIRQDHRIGTERLAHLAQRVARTGGGKFFDVHDRTPVDGAAWASVLISMVIVDSWSGMDCGVFRCFDY